MESFISKIDRVRQAYRRMPALVGAEAIRFFKDRFRDQSWIDHSTQPWKKRKESAKQRNKNKGRAILVKTGRLKRSIRVTRKGQDFVAVGTDVPYARFHNEGARGTAEVTAHTRQNKRMRKVKHTSLKNKRTYTRKEMIDAGDSEVKAHSRKVNLPQRQFIGVSAYLKKNLLRQMQAEIRKAIR